MSSEVTIPTQSTRCSGWAARLFHRLGVRETGGPARGEVAQAGEAVAHVARSLVAEDRYLFVLLKDAPIEEVEAAPAWRALEEQMALIPFGVVPVLQSDGVLVPAEVPAFYLDRHAVTNQQFQRFVRAGGYDTLEIWPQEVWPSLMRFTDPAL